MPGDEVNKFFEDLPSEDSRDETDIFAEDTPASVKEADEITPPAKDDDEPRKNRRHRRLEQQLAASEEARIRAEARADATSEAQRFARDTDSASIDARLLRMYGDTPDGKEAARLHAELLNDTRTSAKQEALKEYEDIRRKEVDEQRKYEQFIESEFESIEDEYNVDITSDAPAARKARREFLELVQKLSPKDENGVVTAFVDFGSAWDLYQSKRGKEQPTNTKQKELAARSMAKTGGAVDATGDQVDTDLAWLRQNGIRV